MLSKQSTPYPRVRHVLRVNAAHRGAIGVSSERMFWKVLHEESPDLVVLEEVSDVKDRAAHGIGALDQRGVAGE